VAHVELLQRHRSSKPPLPRRWGIRITVSASLSNTLSTAQWTLKRPESCSQMIQASITVVDAAVAGCIITGNSRRSMAPWDIKTILIMLEKTNVITITSQSMEMSLHISNSMVQETLRKWWERLKSTPYLLCSKPAPRTSNSIRVVSWRAAAIEI